MESKHFQKHIIHDRLKRIQAGGEDPPPGDYESNAPKGYFFSMCFEDFVFHRSCLDSWAPRTPIIKLKRCMVIQNQGFVNLGKIWKSSPSDVHFDVILKTFWRQSLVFLCVLWGVWFLFYFSVNPGLVRDAGGGHRGLPEITISKDSLLLFRSTRQGF